MRFTLIVLLLCSLCRAAIAGPGELHVALWVADIRDASRPGSAAAAGGVAGFNEALAREICRRINARCVMESVVFADILPGVEAGRYDLGFGNFLRTPEREKRVAFSDAIWSSSSRLLVRSDNSKRLQARFGTDIRPEKLRGVSICGVLGTQQHRYLESIAGERELALSALDSMSEAVKRLGEGQFDLCLMPMLTAYDLLRRETPGSFEFVGPPLLDKGLGGTVHIALGKDKASLRQAVNSAIAAMRADGSYHRVVHQYFPFNLE